jgi:hypothetical protein
MGPSSAFAASARWKTAVPIPAVPRTASALRRLVMIESPDTSDDDRNGLVGRRHHLTAIHHQPQIADVKFVDEYRRARIIPTF